MFRSLMLHIAASIMLFIYVGFSFHSPAKAATCPTPQALGKKPSRLVVVVPGTGQGPKEWQSFLDRLKKEEASQDFAWLVFDHQITRPTFGSARRLVDELASCIDEKVTRSQYSHITLIGHSIGGMLIRRAYLQSADALADQPASNVGWARLVDKMFLFSSVNKGIRSDVSWWSPFAYWLLRTIPHPRLVLEDMELGSDFIADTRVAWIRYFGAIRNHQKSSGGQTPHLPRVVQFWGTEDSIVRESDNADLEAFSGPVIIRVSGAQHSNLHRLEPEYAADPEARWALFKRELFNEDPPNLPPPDHPPQHILIIARGIRDSSISDWVSDLKLNAIKSGVYKPQDIEEIEYGYFSAVHFAIRAIRSKNIPAFRDVYAQRLAENPSAEFDFIGHSNGTYIFGQSMLSTPSMRFRNVVLVAPVLPTDFDWDRLFSRGQIEAIRYDVANRDFPVGVLCSFLNGIGSSDIGPSGVVLFGEGTMVRARVHKVGWYPGGHSAALIDDPESAISNRQHILNFAAYGADLGAGNPLQHELGWMQHISRATPWIAYVLITILTILFAGILIVLGTFERRLKFIILLALASTSMYAFLDIF